MKRNLAFGPSEIHPKIFFVRHAFARNYGLIITYFV